MANNENLKKGKATQFKSGDEAAAAGKKGGVASGEARRKKADLRRVLEEAINGTYKVGDEEMTGAEALISSLMATACNSKSRSSVAAFNVIAKMMGQDMPEQTGDDDDMVLQFLKHIRGE